MDNFQKLTQQEQAIYEHLKDQGFTFLGDEAKENTDWEAKPHFRFKKPQRSKYRPHKGLKEMKKKG